MGSEEMGHQASWDVVGVRGDRNESVRDRGRFSCIRLAGHWVVESMLPVG